MMCSSPNSDSFCISCVWRERKLIKDQLEKMNLQVKELGSIYRGEAGKYGISDNEFWMWYSVLTFERECSQQDICDMWSLSKQTVNSIMSNWVKKGFAFLEAVPDNRKKKFIRLTDEGRAFGKTIVNKICHAEQCAFEKLSAQERQACIDLLGKYVALLKGEIGG